MRMPIAAVLCALLAMPPAAHAERDDWTDVRPVASFAGTTVSGTEAEAVARIRDALRRIRDNALEPISDERLAEIAIAAMAERDRFSKYLPPDELKAMRAETRGVMSGIGIRYEPDGAQIRIIETVPDSPAERADVRAGDAIVAVDGTPVGVETEALGRLVKGPDGTRVRLTLRRDGEPVPLDRVVERGTIIMASVRWAPAGDVGYIRITRFDRQTSHGLTRAIAALTAAIGPGLRGFVLDLRDNPGGLVRASVEVADAFLDSGTILTSLGRGEGASRIHRATAGDEAGDRPLVVLINGRSASAAEILAGALQDHGRALLVGTRSFGKGVIQSVFPLSGGSAVKLTVAEYHTPAGHSIHRIGIAPDVVVDSPDRLALPKPGKAPDPAADPVFARAVDLLRSAPDRGPVSSATAGASVPSLGLDLGSGG